MNIIDMNINCSHSFNIKFCKINENTGELCSALSCTANLINQGKTLVLKGDVNLQKPLNCYEWMPFGKQFLTFQHTREILNVDDTPIDLEPFILRFESQKGSASQYFQFYGSLFQQQNMMQDYARTATYQWAIHENYLDFRDKIILDVGAGSGILSFFAAQSGAKRIYAVEASSMADNCKSLVSANGLNDVIKVITGKIEEIELPESVDIIISEPMGYMLVNERMLESYLFARKFLKEGGKMFPTQANLHLALFSDEQVYLEQTARSSFWTQESFHGVNLSSLKNAALEEVFRQPIVDTWHIGILMSTSISWNFNFENDDVKELQRIEIPFEFNALRTGYIHGLATWFDVGFVGQTRTVWLSTAPTESLTHWYQVRLLLKNPLFVNVGQLVSGKLLMLANEKQSYDLELEMKTGGKEQYNKLDLKMPHFRYNGQPVSQPPPGYSTENSLEQINQHLAVAVATVQQQQQQQQFSNNNIGNNNFNFSPTYSTSTDILFNGISMAKNNKLMDGIYQTSNMDSNDQEIFIIKMPANYSTSDVEDLSDDTKYNKSFLYFSYGSNLLKERIHVGAFGATFISIGALNNFELSFFDYSHRWKGAIASVNPKENSRVLGCIWKVPYSQLEVLDRQEIGYHRLNVQVESHYSLGQVYDCLTYQYSNVSREFASPSPHYKEVIIAGAIEHKLPTEYIDRLRSIPTNGFIGKVNIDLKAIKHLNENKD
ncbi:hypothetical protein Mgra_00005466 [Meloidogyne graminicola]|uniref:type I protein arginine methyltransferase n=1 Tax=Meloidogyne graminicola TaxID=189291 RepID=A0A8S9ZP21_9BILA|nr:hypothetical protein Mgra_00005466 [Meloidogyne graminicola]